MLRTTCTVCNRGFTCGYTKLLGPSHSQNAQVTFIVHEFSNSTAFHFTQPNLSPKQTFRSQTHQYEERSNFYWSYFTFTFCFNFSRNFRGNGKVIYFLRNVHKFVKIKILEVLMFPKQPVPQFRQKTVSRYRVYPLLWTQQALHLARQMSQEVKSSLWPRQ